MKRTQIVVLCASLAAGAAIGLAVHHFFLSRYRASIVLADQTDIQQFRRCADFFRSSDWVRRYARAHSLEGTEAYKEFENQLERGGAWRVAFEHTLWLTRDDLRTVPDVAQKDFPKDLLARSTIVVSATYNDADEAVRVAEFASAFAREVLLGISLSDQIERWRTDIPVQIAATQRTVEELRTLIASLSRRIAGLESVRAKYHDESAAAPRSDTAVQVQVQGARFLALQQQIIGLESERVDTVEQLRGAEQLLRKLETVARIATRWTEPFKAQDDSVLVLKRMEADLAAERERVKTEDASDAAKLAIADLSVPLTGLRTRFAEPSSESFATAVVLHEGPRPYLAILAGVALAFACWLFGARALRHAARTLS